MIKIDLRNIEMSQSIQNMVDKKHNKILKRFDVTSASLVVSQIEHKRIRCNLSVHADHGDFSSTHSSEDFKTALGAAYEKMERQLKDHKEKQSAKGAERIKDKLETEEAEQA